MPSPALIAWSTDSAAALSQLEADDRGPDERSRQLDYAYVLLLCAHFQAYCRGLHSDATQVLVESIDPEIGAVLDANLSFARQLDHRNAQPGTLGADFRRLGIEFWAVVDAADARNAERRQQLAALNAWRNAIAHHDIESRRNELVPQEVTLAACMSWRSALHGLTQTFDRVIAEHLQALLGSDPW
jgi:hypothetical protein